MPLDTKRIDKSIKRVRKFLKKAPKNPTPEKIHDVRTSTRRLESTLNTLKLGKSGKRLLRDLPEIRKRCGKVRDMDVLTGLAMTVEAPKGDKECLVRLVEYLGTQRSKQARKLRELAKQEGPEIRRNLARVGKKIDKLADSGKSDPMGASRQQTSTAMELADQLRTPNKLNKSNLHPYRLKVKELRYVLQLSEMEKTPDIVNTLGEVKDAIGEWHDWEDLVAIASDVLEDGAQSGLVQQLKKMADQKFEQAIDVTNKMRSAYLDAHRSNGRSKPRQIPMPIAAAATAMQS
jgi:CHAD domain-containing protein